MTVQPFDINNVRSIVQPTEGLTVKIVYEPRLGRLRTTIAILLYDIFLLRRQKVPKKGLGEHWLTEPLFAREPRAVHGFSVSQSCLDVTYRR